MTLREIEETLRQSGVPDARFDALQLAAAFTGRSAAYLLASRDEALSGAGLEDAVRRRASREPLQYILGAWDFMGGTYEVSPDCLIPRADTETLVEEALRLVRPGDSVADLCTGSGCIAVSVAERVPCTVTAVELFPKTAAIAGRNAAKHGVSDRVKIIVGDVCRDVFAPGELFDLILSNPPYVTAEEMETLEPELSFEPRAALTDGGDGLSILRAIIDIYPAHLAPGGTMLLEHGADEGAAVREMAEQHGLLAETLRDAGGRERCTRISPGQDR